MLEGCWLGGSHRIEFGGNVGGSGLAGWIFLGDNSEGWVILWVVAN